MGVSDGKAEMKSSTDQLISDRRIPIAERFISINGEGQQAGKLACFIRFPHCNLQCSYCDTMWANDPHASFETATLQELVDWVSRSGVSCVTITGGEPLLQPALPELLTALNIACPGLWIELETNGSCCLDVYAALREQLSAVTISFTMDWKAPSSNMNDRMCVENLSLLTLRDTLKFVVGDLSDLDHMRTLCFDHHLFERTKVFLSPVSGVLDPAEIVDYMQRYRLANVRLQLQLHKIIWPHEVKGV